MSARDAAGIICEFDPMHLGHAHVIGEAAQQCPGGVVCAMSGDFVQWGEPAVFPKQVRAEAAVRAGASLVIELPLNVSLSSAEGFAAGGVRLLESLGVCSHLVFGSECGDTQLLQRAADCLLSPETERGLIAHLRAGVSYAAARERAAAERMGGDAARLLKSPNDILAVEYLKAIRQDKAALIPLAVERRGGGHGEDEGLSSTALRKALREGGEVWESMPAGAAEVYRRAASAGLGPVFPDDTAIMARLRMPGALEDIPFDAEGLSNRIKRAVSEPDLEAVTAAVKTKRYARTRIRRMLMCAALGIRAADMEIPVSYVRVLAADERGRALLRRISEASPLPVITKPASAKRLTGGGERIFALTASAADFYALFMTGGHRSGGGEWRRSPVMV